jgi:hypothetical protein
MKIRFFNLIAALVAMVAGLATLLGYFISSGALRDARLVLLSLVSVLAAWAILAGALNLLIVHARKFTVQAPGSFYSLVLLLGFLLVLGANFTGALLGWPGGANGAANSWFLTYIISSGGAALAGLVAFFLVFAAYRLLRTRRTPLLVIFVVTVVLALLVLAPWPSFVPNPPLIGGATMRDLLRTLTRVPAVAGARGLLLGVALGGTATGLRVLLGLERPYGD